MKSEEFRLGAVAIVNSEGVTGFAKGEKVIMKGVYWSHKSGSGGQYFILTRSLRDKDNNLNVEGNIALAYVDSYTSDLEQEFEKIKGEINSESK